MPELIIVGGGVIGLSAAYHLARAGSGVILLEKGRVGAGSSSRAGGIITGHLWDRTGILARQISLGLYRELSAELGAYGYSFQAVGCLNLFSPGEWQGRERLLPLYDDCGMPYEILKAAQIRQRWPRCSRTMTRSGFSIPWADTANRMTIFRLWRGNAASWASISARAARSAAS